MPAPSKAYQLTFKLMAIIVPLVVALTGVFYGTDLNPALRDFCESILPPGTLVHEVDATVGDAGVAR